MITITGSRLQALIYGWAGLVALLVLGDDRRWLGIVLAVLGLGLGASVARRRVDLGSTDVSARSIARASTAARADVDASLGHRYLTLRFGEGSTYRIEVPVEVRPNVRDWVAGGEPTTGAAKPDADPPR